MIPYLIFQLLDKQYGVEAHCVLEIARLPEITPLEEAPPFILGALNLRGSVVPVVDLNLRMGRQSAPPRLSDAVLVMQVEPDGVVGLIISDVLEVLELDESQIEPAPAYQEQDSERPQPFVTRVAQRDEQMVMLLEPNRLLLSYEALQQLAMGEITPEDLGAEPPFDADDPACYPERRIFFADATPDERDTLQTRARHLISRPETNLSQMGKHAFAVISLAGEMLAVKMNIIRSFAKQRAITPIPCTPVHILGDINLFGEILTMVDLLPILGLPSKPDIKPEKIMVLDLAALTIGTLIDDINDVIHLDEQEILPPPTAVGTLKRDQILGALPYQERMITLLDLEKVLSQEALVVNETVT
ncbi:MAG: chemotaxis protein CheW [Magnetococcales bacterium]|nr:chemotaxis protein CheW [Magnetococcales bacterium]